MIGRCPKSLNVVPRHGAADRVLSEGIVHIRTLLWSGARRASATGLSRQAYRDIELLPYPDSQLTPAVLSGLSSGTIIT